MQNTVPWPVKNIYGWYISSATGKRGPFLDPVCMTSLEANHRPVNSQQRQPDYDVYMQACMHPLYNKTTRMHPQ